MGQSVEHGHSHEQLHAYIGVSLVLGFVFMLLVDQIGSSHMHSSSDGRCDAGVFVFYELEWYKVSKSVLSTFLDPEAARTASSKVTITLGLVVHAAGKKK